MATVTIKLTLTTLFVSFCPTLSCNKARIKLVLTIYFVSACVTGPAVSGQRSNLKASPTYQQLARVSHTYHLANASNSPTKKLSRNSPKCLILLILNNSLHSVTSIIYVIVIAWGPGSYGSKRTESKWALKVFELWSISTTCFRI